MTNNYPEWEPGGRGGGGGRPPTRRQPWVARGTWMGFPGAMGGWEKSTSLGAFL